MSCVRVCFTCTRGVRRFPSLSPWIINYPRSTALVAYSDVVCSADVNVYLTFNVKRTLLLTDWMRKLYTTRTFVHSMYRGKHAVTLTADSIHCSDSSTCTFLLKEPDLQNFLIFFLFNYSYSVDFYECIHTKDMVFSYLLSGLYHFVFGHVAIRIAHCSQLYGCFTI